MLTLAIAIAGFIASFYLAGYGVVYHPATANYEQCVKVRHPVLG